MLKALIDGHENIKKIIEFEEEVIKEIGQEKMEYETLNPTKEMEDEIEKLISKDLDNALRIKDKLEKYGKIDELKLNLEEKYTEENKDLDKDELAKILVCVDKVFSNLEYKLFRNIVVNEKIRSDGRAMDEIRPLSTDIDLLPRTHGSALFTRGETQALSITTLGAIGEHQILDGLGLEDQKRFMLHYNFPQFGIGETGRYRSPRRREIGHGN